jgi:exonuclease III
MLQVDLGAFVLINVYVPNAGCRGRKGDSNTERVDLKERFLSALLERANELAVAGREVRHSRLQPLMILRYHHQLRL